MTPDLDNAADILRTATMLAPHIRHTPLEPCDELSERVGFEVKLKLECWQVTGSFKPRVSLSKLLWADDAERARGVTASTAGGHGVGVAYAARALGIGCHVHLPHSADRLKVQRIRALGAKVSIHAEMQDAVAAATAMAQADNVMLVPAYNDPAVIAGSTTIGLEVLNDGPAVDAFCVGAGGGGIAAGLGLAARAVQRKTSLFVVQPEGPAVLNHWLRAGRVVPVSTTGTSIADGLGAGIPEQVITFPLLQRFGAVPLEVSDAEIAQAMGWVFDTLQLILEPSGAAPIAALLRHAAAFEEREVRSLALVLTGRTISPERLRPLLFQ